MEPSTHCGGGTTLFTAVNEGGLADGKACGWTRAEVHPASEPHINRCRTCAAISRHREVEADDGISRDLLAPCRPGAASVTELSCKQCNQMVLAGHSINGIVVSISQAFIVTE